MSFPKKYASVEPGKYDYSIAEPLLIQHVTAVLQVNLKLDLNLFKRILIMLFYILVFVGPLILVGFYL